MPPENTFQPFAVAMPTGLMPLLQRRIFQALLTSFWGSDQPYDLTNQELIDLDTLMTRDLSEEAHNMLLNGRELSLLKRFLIAESALVRVSNNYVYWGLISDLLLSVIRPTEVVKLSFCR